jgi:predicted HAD superfamily phosphohydrolase
VSRVLLTRLKSPCSRCTILKSRLVGAKTKDYSLSDADTPDGMSLALLYEVQTVPALIDGDEVVTDLDEIVWRLRATD